jgi:malate permease and related proteins
VLWVALTIVASIAVGVEAERRKGPAAGRAARGVLWLMLYVLMPPVVFFNIARLDITANLGAGIGLAWAALVLSALLAWGVGRRLLRLERPTAGVLSIVAMQGNTGILGLPFVAAVLGFDRLPEAVAYDSLVQAPVFLLLSFAVAAATGTRAGEGARERVRAFFLRNPPLAAVFLALVTPDALAPDVLVDASRVLVLAMVPLGFFAVGVTMAEEAEEGALRFPPPFTRAVAAATVFRLVVTPLILLALAAPLIDLPGTFLLQAAMPAGLHIVMLAHAYGLDLPFAAGAIVWTTAVWMVFATAAVIIV